MLNSSIILWIFYISNNYLTITSSYVLLTIPKLYKNLLNQIASCTIVEQAVHLASKMDKAIQVCFLLLQDIAPL